MKRFVSLLLALVMTVAMFPASALAAQIQPAVVTTAHINPLYAGQVDPEDLKRPQAVSTLAAEEFHTDIDAAGADMRRQMNEHRETIEIGLVFSAWESTAVKQAMHDVFDAAVVHTGVPTEGDYLRCNYDGWNANASAKVSGGVYYATLTYAMTYKTTAAQETELDQAVDALLAQLDPVGSDYDKLTAVYDWICANIVYDYDSTEQLKYTAYAALVNGTAVCQGYAVLLYRLALELGIDCRYISGTGNGGAHGWNIVKLGDLYYNVDATWDASWMQGVGYYNYFLQCEETFTEGGTDHIRDAEYDTDQFHAAYPMTPADYDATPIAQGSCGENVTWCLRGDGQLTIFGSGPMEDYTDETQQPWYDCAQQITSAVVVGTVTGLGSYALAGMENLTRVTLEDGVTSIGDRAMWYCDNLTEVVIPGSVTDMGEAVFYSSDALHTAGPQAGDYNIRFGWQEAIPANAFESLHYALTAVTLPDTLKSIGDNAFTDCAGLQSIALPDGLISIGAGAFANSGLTELRLPDSLTGLGEEAFYQSRLTRVVLGDQLKVLPRGAFSNCTSLTAVELGGVETIGAEAFRNCWSLPEMVFPATVTGIGADAFAACSALTTMTFLGNLPQIHENAFGAVTARAYYPGEDGSWTADGMADYGGSLTWLAIGTCLILDRGTCGTDITWELNEYYELTITGSGDMYDWEANEAPWDDYSQHITTVTVSDGVTSVGSYAFFHNYDLNAVTLPDSVTRIGGSAFVHCDALMSMKLPARLVHIGDYAFDCSALTGIDFPDTLVTIGKGAFSGSELTAARIPEGVTSLGDQAFMGCPLQTLTVPASLTDIGSQAFSNCAPLKYINVAGDNPAYRCDSQGAMYSADGSTLIVVPGGYTGSFVIPSCVKRIDYCAFGYCRSLTAVTIPSSVTAMDGSIFWECDGLTSLAFPDSMTAVPKAFAAGCDNLTTIHLPETVTQIGDMAFFETGLQSVVLPAKISRIGDYCFADADLEELVFTGNAPAFEGGNVFRSVNATVYYPAENDTWTADVMQQYGGTLTWTNRCDGGHHGVEDPAVEPTCTQPGRTAGTHCVICGQILSGGAEIPSLGHREVTDAGMAATCTESGITEGSHCGVCGEVLKAREEIPALGHRYETLVTHPTCTEQGVTTHTCAACGHSYSDGVTEALGHDYRDGACSRCGDIPVAAPVVTASNVASSGKIRLRWNSVANARQYMVYRADGENGPFTRVFTTANTSYTNTSAAAGSTYYYYVVAVTAEGIESAPSGIAVRTCDLARPTVSTANVTSSGKIRLTWPEVDGAVSYKIYRAASEDGSYTLMKTTSATSYTNTSAKPGVRYYYKVRAIGENPDADSAYSGAVSRICDLAQPKVTASNVASTGKIRLTWAAVDGAVSYKVYRSGEKNGTYALMKTVTGTTYTNTSAKAGEQYYYKVVAVCDNTGGNSAASAIVTRTCDLPRPVAAASLTAAGKPRLTWAAVDGAVSYKVYRAAGESGSFTLMKTTTGTSYTNTSAKSGVAYRYKVVAVHSNTAANSAYSAIVSITAG